MNRYDTIMGTVIVLGLMFFASLFPIYYTNNANHELEMAKLGYEQVQINSQSYSLKWVKEK